VGPDQPNYSLGRLADGSRPRDPDSSFIVREIYSIYEVVPRLSEKLKRLTMLHGSCMEQERQMRAKQLALMRERNLFLEKCRHIEQLGEHIEWKDPNPLGIE
jgi:hypothetical protein